MVIYLDIILLLNAAIDTLLLWFTAYFRKERFKWWRMLLAALFGSTYVAFFFLPQFAGFYQWFVKLLFSVLMLLIAFGFRRMLAFLHNLVIFYFVAFVFGGGVFALQYFLTSHNEIVNGILVTHNDSFGVGTKPTLLILLVGFLLVGYLSRRSYQAIEGPRKVEAFLVEVIVKLQGETILCRGLVDTGNQLHEPISRTPVMVMESKMLAHMLPAGLLAFAAEEDGKLERLERLLDDLPTEWQGRIRLIPFRSVSRGMDFLVALKPDQVVVVQHGSRFVTEKVLIGLNPVALAADQQYQAIVHPALVQNATEQKEKSLEQEG
ncbi:sigma-E processing peptidase SpoIIGA [Brevibacillus fulvus]|uniref:Stage II sporulation protein GA (Sporulation sigma-E factor processing peptidase) n=1 Tax=Brevibacillus fulvus TaxID=1125967 RepID=A0A938Y1A5_9BACL|nr:stage II sporulation protein GA (sporulation sigma-E factor processing peptidase) [Brevibacillus fulvus]